MKNDYIAWTKEALIQRILDLELLLEQDLDKKNEEFLIEFPWAGNLGQWHWFYQENRVIFNDKKVLALGYDPKEIGEVGFDFFTSKLHPDDYERVMQNMRNHLSGKIPAYETEYRIQHKEGHYIWYYDRGTVTKRNASGKPLLIEGVVFDISESKRVEERLRDLSERDSLTRVYNRRLFFEHLEIVKLASSAKESPFSLLLIDIDRFKQINDTYGHLVGDEAIKTLIDVIQSEKRTEDKIYRYGGDEFFVLLEDTPLQGAIKFAKRLHQSLAKNQFRFHAKFTISAGVVEYKLGETTNDFIRRVDDLMYQAKSSGRNQIMHD